MWPFTLFHRHDPLGQRGERLAARALRKAGCHILTRNYRCPAGEVDLVALHGETLVFAEVKARSSDRYTDPEAAVDARKRQRYRQAARHYLSETRSHDRPVRFDVVAILIEPGKPPRINHIVDAFT